MFLAKLVKEKISKKYENTKTRYNRNFCMYM